MITLENGLPVDDIEVEDGNDYPDFADAFIFRASVMEGGFWREATDSELDELNEDSSLVYDQALKSFF